ncbi:MAG: LLM class flavin-dependent oxidoreductase [Anaerolineaceae bacterium]|nr:LLM class flavin-dependent oxidoreductase [Anaerolineaceae bacterium]
MFRCVNPPEIAVQFVQGAEAAGFDEVWLVEDCFFAGGIASVTTALAKTERILVGLGIMPAVARNPAFAAMEIAALGRLFPGRFLPGFGHGVGDWMKQIGAFPSSQLAALEEVTLTVRALLAGERVSFHGQHVHLDQVQLEFPLETPPPVLLGVRGPKSLQLSGRSADGTILAEHASAPYVAWAREQIRAGQRENGRENDAHRLTVYTYCVVEADRETALSKLRPQLARAIASGNLGVYLEPLGIQDEAQRLVAEKDAMGLAAALPDEWITQLAVVGTPEDCRDGIRKLADAGADSVILVPIENDLEALTAFSNLLPLLKE